MRYELSSDMAEFAGYELALKALERSFRKAGLGINFLAGVWPLHGKVIHIREKSKVVKTVFIEGCSPAQAVKDVAAAVRI